MKRSKVCKKKRKKGTGCKTHKGRRASLPALPRTVTLTWDSGADIDLKVYDMKGHHAGIQNGVIINGIPGATYSGNDSDGFGPETFSDPFGRRVGYLVCYVSGPSANVTLTDSGLGGTRSTGTLGPPGPPPTSRRRTRSPWAGISADRRSLLSKPTGAFPRKRGEEFTRCCTGASLTSLVGRDGSVALAQRLQPPAAAVRRDRRRARGSRALGVKRGGFLSGHSSPRTFPSAGGYCVGDVGGDDRGYSARLRGFQPWRRIGDLGACGGACDSRP